MHYYNNRAMKNFTLATVILMVFYVHASCHPIKMSTGKLTYDKESKKIMLTINFFADDFASHLRKTYRLHTVEFSNPTPMLRDVVKDYVAKKFILKINNVNQQLALESLVKTDDNVVQAKFSIPEAYGFRINVLEVYDQLLFEAFNDQVNVLHVDMEGKGESQIFRFSPGDTYAVMKMDFVCR